MCPAGSTHHVIQHIHKDGLIGQHGILQEGDEILEVGCVLIHRILSCPSTACSLLCICVYDVYTMIIIKNVYAMIIKVIIIDNVYNNH